MPFVAPITNCPHIPPYKSLLKHFSYGASAAASNNNNSSTTTSAKITSPTPTPTINSTINSTSYCKTCKSPQPETWTCLHCITATNCSRYIHKHALLHHQHMPSHSVALSWSDLSFYCYHCDAYLENEDKLGPFYRDALEIKFGEMMREGGQKGDSSSSSSVHEATTMDSNQREQIVREKLQQEVLDKLKHEQQSQGIKQESSVDALEVEREEQLQGSSSTTHSSSSQKITKETTKEGDSTTTTTKSSSSSSSSSSAPPPNLSDPHTQRIHKVAQLIQNANNIVVLSGAGLSVSAGIPDFRSLGGFYNNPPPYLKPYNLEDPMDVFDLEYFTEDSPLPFFEVCKEFLKEDYSPTVAHHFIQLLNQKGKLKRYYTQNIDGLDLKTGDYADKIVFCHGSYHSATCTECSTKYEPEIVLECIRKDPIEVPMCTESGCEGIIKPDVVLFGEQLPENFHKAFQEDSKNVDLMILLGTSLSVAPVSMLPDIMPSGIPRVLINMDAVGGFKLDSGLSTANKKKKRKNKRARYEDYMLPGDLQRSCSLLVNALEWEQDLVEAADQELVESMRKMTL